MTLPRLQLQQGWEGRTKPPCTIQQPSSRLYVSQVTMSLRLPKGCPPPFLCYFPLCTPAPSPPAELVAERTEPGAESIHSGSAGCLRSPNVLTHGIPQYSRGASSPGQLKGKVRKGKTWTTRSPTFLLGFGCGGAQVLASRKGSTFRKHQEPTTGLKTGGCVPARLGQSPPQLPPAASHPVHTCLGPGGLRCRQPSGPGQRGGVGGPAWPHQRHPAYPRLLTKASRACSAPPQPGTVKLMCPGLLSPSLDQRAPPP